MKIITKLFVIFALIYNVYNKNVQVLKCNYTKDNWKTVENYGDIIITKEMDNIFVKVDRLQDKRMKMLDMYCIECFGEIKTTSVRTCMKNQVLRERNYKYDLQIDFASKNDAKLEIIGISIVFNNDKS